ncbi:MAG: S41 family peptidase [Chloroflexota bacterium]
MTNPSYDPSPPEQPRRFPVAVILLIVALLCVTTAVAGYYIGLSSAEPVTETVTEVAEVTREVTVVPTAEPTPLPTATEPAPEPTPIPTDVPADQIAEASEEGEGAEEETVEEESAAIQEAPTPEPFVPRAEDVGDIDFELFYEAWQILTTEYDGQLPTNEELLFSAINGSIELLGDEHTRFVNPDTAQRIRQNQGPVEGIGAIVTENEDGLIEIVRPIDGQPADLAGVKAGDVLIAVDGESVIGQSLDEVVLIVRGPSGTQVTITVRRPGVEEPIDFTITRARFEVPVVEAEMLPENVAYVRLTTFLDQGATADVEDALEPLLAQNPAGIVFDLRDNGGGFLSEAINVADLFLPESIILLERNIRGLNETFRADDGDIGEQLPLVVLVNAGSASASEIVAGAIQDNGRGVIVGEVTFGKGSVQQVHTLSNGAELRVTIARWFTPNNNTIDGAGITPDIAVETPEDLGGDNDTQLQEAVDFILSAAGE